MGYEGNIYRPPSEAQSFVLQCTVGCSHNACTFCGMFKDKKFRVKELDEILGDIDEASSYMPGLREVFLADGDAIAMPQETLLAILDHLKKRFPNLESVATYAGPRSTLAKTPEELKILRDAGLTRAYLGVESGDDKVLRDTCKGVNAEQMERAGRNLVEAGIELCAIILIGLAGTERSLENARASARIANAIKPAALAAMTYTPIPGTRMYRQIENGEFHPLDNKGVLVETRELASLLDVDRLVFTSNHVSNPVAANCVLPDDREALLDALDDAIACTPGGGTRRSSFM
jgi:radical SAM superfamily enzyme YgiQ (UPF0313 family)